MALYLNLLKGILGEILNIVLTLQASFSIGENVREKENL